MSNKRIGIFGGTFNPPHNGHLKIAEAALSQFKLDKVFFMPAGHPPHKADPGDEMTGHRLNMVHVATDGRAGLFVSELEIKKPGKSYTCETLIRLNELHPDSDFYLIIGGDSLNDFDSWYHPEIIVKYATILACQRPCVRESGGVIQTDDMTRGLARRLSEKYNGKFEIIDMEPIDISSSMIRGMVAAGEDIRALVPEAVREYIYLHKLYSFSG